MIKNPKIISIKEVFKGKHLKIEVRKIKLPNGKIVIREIVDVKSGVGILPYHNGYFYLIRQHREAANKIVLQIPAGLIDKGEEPKNAAKRELEEEIGMKPKILKKICSYYPSIGFSMHKMHLYLAKGLLKGKQNLEPSENLEIVKIPVKKAYKMLEKNEFQDVETILSLNYFFKKFI